MGLVKALTRQLGREEVYECVLCANRFERERRNCPACGSAEIEAVT
ncbi:MAG: hypothetical protein ABEJ68_05110 [Halobacteriaceae archaeon]